MRSKGETQERGCNCGLGCEPGQEPGWGRSKGEDSVAFRRMGGGGKTQIISPRASGMGKKS